MRGSGNASAQPRQVPEAPLTVVAGNVVAFTAARIFAAVLNVLSLALFTRLLDPPDYGYYLLIASQAYIAHAFASHWLLSAFFAGFQEKTGQLSTFAAVTAFTLLLAAMGAGVAVLLAAITSTTALAFIAILTGFTLFEAALTFARAALWISTAAIAVVLRAILILALGGGALSLSPDALTLATAFGAGNLLASIPVLWSAVPLFSERPRRSVLRGFVSFGWPLVLSSGVNIAGQYVDRLLVGYFLGVAALGSYGAVSDLVRQSFVLMGEAVSVSLVAAAKRSASLGEEGESKRLLGFSFVALTVILGFGIALFAVFGTEVISVLLGAGFRDVDVGLLAVLALGSGLLMFRVFYLAQMIFFGRPAMLDLVSSVMLLSTTLIAGFVLLPLAGAMGAAMAIVLGQLAGCCTYALTNRGSLPWKLGAATLVAAAALVFLAASKLVDMQGWPSGPTLFAQLLVFVLCFAAISWYTNLIGLRETLSRRRSR